MSCDEVKLACLQIACERGCNFHVNIGGIIEEAEAMSDWILTGTKRASLTGKPAFSGGLSMHEAAGITVDSIVNKAPSAEDIMREKLGSASDIRPRVVPLTVGDSRVVPLTVAEEPCASPTRRSSRAWGA